MDKLYVHICVYNNLCMCTYTYIHYIISVVEAGAPEGPEAELPIRPICRF